MITAFIDQCIRFVICSWNLSLLGCCDLYKRVLA